MPQIAAFDDVKAQRKERQVPTGTAWRTNFIDPEANNPASAQAFLVEGTPGRVIKSHYHDHDQYQVIVMGDGVLGKHQLQVNAVHFSRRHTPYGPIVFGEKHMGFLTLRAHQDGGAQYLDDPEKMAKLKSVENRKPWQATELPQFSRPGEGAVLHTFGEISDDEGLASFSMSVAPNAKALAPDPADSNGQYLIVVRGSLHYEGKEYRALSVAFIKPQEGRFELVAGADGLDVLVLHFPRAIAEAAVVPQAAKGAPGTRVWQCMLCAFVYDEAKGMPDEGIAPGTPWEEVPETWFCPDCSASKSDFQMALVE